MAANGDDGTVATTTARDDPKKWMTYDALEKMMPNGKLLYNDLTRTSNGQSKKLYYKKMIINNVVFLNNAIIITTILTSNDVVSDNSDTIWECPVSSDVDETDIKNGIIDFNEVLFDSNIVGPQYDYLFEFDYQRIGMKSVLIDENDCAFMQDCSVSIEDSEFLDNSGSFILLFSRHDVASRDLGNLVLESICISSIVKLNDVGNGFVYINNMTSDDYIDVIDSNFSSGSIEYTFYMTSELFTSLNSNADLTHVSLDNIRVLNNNESGLVWTTADLDSSEGIVDGTNGDVGLNLNVTNSLFSTTVMKGLFGSLTSASTASNNIIFEDSSDYIFYYDKCEFSCELVVNGIVDLHILRYDYGGDIESKYYEAKKGTGANTIDKYKALPTDGAWSLKSSKVSLQTLLNM